MYFDQQTACGAPVHWSNKCLMLKQLFPSLTKQNKGKPHKHAKTCNTRGVKRRLGVTLVDPPL